MKQKIVLLLLVVILLPNGVDAKRGCCSHHGGVAGCSASGRQICKDGTLSPTCTCSATSKSKSNSNTSQKKDVYGCTDINAYNYNAKATKDNGSCIAKKYGCTDKEAINYDKNANMEDNSCQFEKKEIKEESISYNTEYKETNINSESKEKIVQQGKNGSKEVIYHIIEDESGNIIKKEKIGETIIEEPIKEIIETNTISLEKFTTKIEKSPLENKPKEDVDNTWLGFWIVAILISFSCFWTHKDGNLLLNKIAKHKNIIIRITFYIGYVFLIIPPFIDSIFCVLKLVKNKGKF